MGTQEDVKWFIINELEKFSSVLCSHWIDNQQSMWLVEQYKEEILRIFSNFSTDNNLGNMRKEKNRTVFIEWKR